MSRRKILFIHNKATWYRMPFFNRIAQDFNVEFVFTRENQVNGINANSRVISPIGPKHFQISPGLITSLFNRKYDLVIFPPLDSPGEIIDNLICYLIVRIRHQKYGIWSEMWEPTRFVLNPPFPSMYKIFKKRVLKLISAQATGCMVSGTKAKKFLLSLGVDRQKIVISPDVSIIQPTPRDYIAAKQVKKDLGGKKNKVVLFVGRLITRKGVVNLIQAFSRLVKEVNDSILVIVGGEGHYGSTIEEKVNLRDLKSLCHRLGIENRVYFMGNLNTDQLIPYYMVCDLLVLPALGNERVEAWGLVVNEAMQFAKPVIVTTAVGAGGDLVLNNVNGYVIKEKDNILLASRIKRILLDLTLSRKMGKNGQRLIYRNFTYEKEFQGFKRLVNLADK